MRASRIRCTNLAEANRSGATYNSASSPSTARDSVRALAVAPRSPLISPTLPGATASSARAWSCISDTSGETTTVRSSRINAGSW